MALPKRSISFLASHMIPRTTASSASVRARTHGRDQALVAGLEGAVHQREGFLFGHDAGRDRLVHGGAPRGFMIEARCRKSKVPQWVRRIGHGRLHRTVRGWAAVLP